MSHSFLAFIDESGDDGLEKFRQFNQKGGSSNWLIISAIVMRATHNDEVVNWKKELKEQALIAHQNIHFRELKHSQKVISSQFLANKPIRCINIISDKRTIPKNTFGKNMLYWNLSRHLIERLSWFCRDMRPQVKEGDGRLKIEFARRGGMQYSDFQSYLSKLKYEDSPVNLQNKSQIHWSVIDISSISAQDTTRSAALQLADICASSTAAFFEPDIYGRTEPTYLNNLSRVLYKRDNNTNGYGLKILTSNLELSLNKNQRDNIARLNERSPSS